MDATAATSPRREDPSLTFTKRSTTGNASIPPSAVDPRRVQSRLAARENKEFLGRNEELNRGIKMISGHTGGPKGPKVPADGLQRRANSRE